MAVRLKKQMSTVQAISQASRSEMDILNAAAQEMGRTTQFSATEAGQAEEYMAMAGWKAKEMVAGLPGIMNLAAASGEDLASTSDIVTDAPDSLRAGRTGFRHVFRRPGPGQQQFQYQCGP